VCENSEKRPQVPPLRFAPVGMTILLCPQQLQREILDPLDRIIILTGADQDFLLRAASDDHVYGSFYYDMTKRIARRVFSTSFSLSGKVVQLRGAEPCQLDHMSKQRVFH